MKTNHNKEGYATSGLPWAHFPRRVVFWENSFSVKGGNSFKLCDWSCTPECAPWSSSESESTGSARRRSVIRCKQGYPEASTKNIHYTLHLLCKKCSRMCLLFIRATDADVLLAPFIWSLMWCDCKMMTDIVQSYGLHEGNNVPTYNGSEKRKSTKYLLEWPISVSVKLATVSLK